MQTNQFLEEAKEYAIPGKYRVILNFIAHIIINCLCIILLIFVYQLFIDTSEEISPLRSFSIDHLFLIIVISTLISAIYNYFLFFRKGKSQKLQREYLEDLCDKIQEEISDTAASLQLLRAVPEIVESSWTEQEHIDDIQKNIKKLAQIKEAIDMIG